MDKIILDTVGVAKELHTVSSRVVYNDASIDIYASLVSIFLVTALLFVIGFGIWKLSREVAAKEKDSELKLIATCVTAAIILMIFCMSFVASYISITEAAKRLTTPEWYALERIERLVK